jgi:hypothetical protein
MRHLLLLVPFILLTIGCPPDPVVPPPNPPVDTDWCGRMCEHLQDLGCEEGQPVYNNDKPGPEGVPNQSCEEWCVELQDPDHLYFINPRCVTMAPDCDSIEVYRKKDPAVCTPDAG